MDTLKRVAYELKQHSPFTAFGAVTGIAIMGGGMIWGDVSSEVSDILFYTLHPIHVLLSGLVTAGMYARYRGGKVWATVLVGYTGAIGVSTASDAVIPFLGGSLLNVEMGFHVPFLEKWWLVNPLALAGISIGCWSPTTKFPHYGHVLLSTWASLFYFTTFGVANWTPLLPFILLFLFLAVWIPCCVSDIVYPLLFVRGK